MVYLLTDPDTYPVVLPDTLLSIITYIKEHMDSYTKILQNQKPEVVLNRNK